MLQLKRRAVPVPHLLPPKRNIKLVCWISSSKWVKHPVLCMWVPVAPSLPTLGRCTLRLICDASAVLHLCQRAEAASVTRTPELEPSSWLQTRWPPSGTQWSQRLHVAIMPSGQAVPAAIQHPAVAALGPTKTGMQGAGLRSAETNGSWEAKGHTAAWAACPCLDDRPEAARRACFQSLLGLAFLCYDS